ncbi:hypothetical protein ACFL59_05195 [Planctomycetota bacterium]
MARLSTVLVAGAGVGLYSPEYSRDNTRSAVGRKALRNTLWAPVVEHHEAPSPQGSRTCDTAVLLVRIVRHNAARENERPPELAQGRSGSIQLSHEGERIAAGMTAGPAHTRGKSWISAHPAVTRSVVFVHRRKSPFRLLAELRQPHVRRLHGLLADPRLA